MTGNPLLDKILLGLNGAVVLTAAGLVYYAHTGIKAPPTDQALEEKNLQSDAVALSQVTAFAMKPMTVNLYSPGSRLRYLKVDINLLPFKQQDTELLKAHQYVVQNELIRIAAGMTPEELGSITGKILLESRLKKAVNDSFPAPVVKSIFFGAFLVQ